jgi:SAM-dependent methyltransferase
MGIFNAHIQILCLEQEKYPLIKGDVLTLGQQAIYSTLDEVKSKISIHKKINIKKLPKEFDTSNKIPQWNGTLFEKNTNAHSLLTMLGADNVYVADVSDYEGPDYLIDLNFPVDSIYHERFDTIVDVGTLEHIFDVPVALQNICNMLKQGGNIIFIVQCSNAIDHGFYMFSPTLFYDYFTANGFTIKGCYLTEGSPYVYGKKRNLYKYEGVGAEIPFISQQNVEVAFIATKEKNNFFENNNKPTQGLYANWKYWGKDKSNTPSLKSSFLELLKKNILHLAQIGKNYVPFSLEKVFYGKKRRGKNITYLGKY